MTERATMSEEGYPFFAYVDGVLIGQGTKEQGKALIDELNASDRKCDDIKKIMEDKVT